MLFRVNWTHEIPTLGMQRNYVDFSFIGARKQNCCVVGEQALILARAVLTSMMREEMLVQQDVVLIVFPSVYQMILTLFLLSNVKTGNVFLKIYTCMKHAPIQGNRGGGGGGQVVWTHLKNHKWL